MELTLVKSGELDQMAELLKLMLKKQQRVVLVNKQPREQVHHKYCWINPLVNMKMCKTPTFARSSQSASPTPSSQSPITMWQLTLTWTTCSSSEANLTPQPSLRFQLMIWLLKQHPLPQWKCQRQIQNGEVTASANTKMWIWAVQSKLIMDLWYLLSRLLTWRD